MKNVLFAAALAMIAAVSSAQVDPAYLATIPVDNVFQHGDEYRYVLPPKQAFYGAVSLVQSREDSKFLAFFADPRANRAIPYLPQLNQFPDDATKQPAIYIHNIAAGSSQVAFPIEYPQTRIENVAWLNGSPYLAVLYSKNQRSYVALIDPQTNRPQVFDIGDDSAAGFDVLYYAPTRSLVLPQMVLQGNKRLVQLYTIDIDTNQRRAVPLDTQYLGNISSDGNRIFFIDRDWRSGDILVSHDIDIRTGAVTETKNQLYTASEPAYPVTEYGGPVFRIGEGLYLPSEMDYAPETSPDGNGTNPQNRQIPPPRRTAILTLNGLGAGSTPDGKYAWFVDRSGLNLCDIAPLSAEQFEALAKDVVKKETMSRAKQVGTAMAIYTADYDDLFPPTSNWQDNVNPYIKNKKMMDGFVYLLNGEDASSFEDPSGTILGMIETPFGTAYVRVDSSVVWKDRPKPVRNQVQSSLKT